MAVELAVTARVVVMGDALHEADAASSKLSQ